VRRANLVVLIAATASNALGQGDSEGVLTDADFLQNATIVNSVTHLPQRLSDSPVAVSIIDRRMIAASGATSPVELLRLVPGFQAYYVNGNRYGANYHSLDDEYPRRMEVKVDGRPVYEPILSSVEWHSLGVELQDIDYIEVVRGPNQPADGANAFLGTINIVTRSPVANNGGAVRATVGYADMRRLSAVYNTSLGDVHNRFTVSYQTNDGFPEFEGEPVNDQLEIGHLGYRGVWTPNLTDVLDVQIGYSSSENGLGGEGLNGRPGDVRPRDYRYTYQSLDWQRNLSSTQNIELLFYHNYISADDEPQQLGTLAEELGIPPALIPILFPGFDDFQLPPLELEARSQRFDLEFRHNIDFDRRLRMNWGTALRYDRANSEQLFDTDDWLSETSLRLFTNIEAKPTRWLTLNLGLMGEHNEATGYFLSPRFSTNFHLTPAQTIRLTASRGYRPPTLLEANQFQAYRAQEVVGLPPELQVITDPDMENESITNYEIGYLGEFSRLGLTLDIKFFTEKQQHLIEEARAEDVPGDIASPVLVRTNAIDMTSSGYEIGLNYRPTPAFLLAGQFSHIHLDGERQRTLPIFDESDFADMRNAMPKFSTNILASYRFPWQLEFSANYFLQDNANWQQGANVERFDRLDLRLAKTLEVGQTSTLIELILQNALNEDYIEYHDFNVFERRAYIRVSVDWQ
jgi:iron complex outermembrane receptor protein